jgi:hypothetical protein
MKRFSKELKTEIENTKIDEFLTDILKICEKHGFSLGHEDNHGAFKIVKFNESYNEWLLDAHDGT